MAFWRKKQVTISRNMPVSDLVNNRFSYHSNRTSEPVRNRLNDASNSGSKEVKKKAWLINIPTYLIAGFIIIVILYSLILSPAPKVEIVDNTNLSFVQSNSVYQEAADGLFKQSLLNRTKLTINTDRIADELTKQFPEIERATVIVPVVNHTAIVELLPAQAVCVISNSQGYFAVDSDGKAILRLNQSSLNKLNLPIITDQSGIKISIGQEIISTQITTFVSSLIDEFNAEHTPISSMTLVDVPYELNITLKGEPYYIKFNLLGNPRLEAGTYFATIRQLQTTKTTPAQYVDVRVQGRAYYQ